MVETIRFSKIGVDDLSLGDGTFEARLADERIVAKTQINLARLAPGLAAGRVLFIGSDDIGDNSAFTFDNTNSVLSVPEIDSGSSSGGDLTIDSTSHATKGDILLQPSGGNVGMGVASSPDSALHVAATGATVITVENDSGVTSGDPAVEFKISGTSKFILGVDDSDSDTFKISVGGALGTATALAIDSSGNVGVGFDTPLASLHVYSGSAGGVTPTSAADDLMVENSVSAGITIATPNTSAGYIAFADPDSNVAGTLSYDHSDDTFTFAVGGATAMTIDGPKLLINETANTKSTSGLTINQTSSDDEVISLKSSDVGHAGTSVTEADTYGYFQKVSGTQGGILQVGISEGIIGIEMRGVGTSADTSKNSGSGGFVTVQGYSLAGTDLDTPGADENIFVVQSGAAARFIVDSEGDLHNDGGGSLNTFDDYDDVKLLSAIKSLSVPKGKAKELFGEWLDEHLEVLVQHGVVSRGGFISHNGFRGLLIDAMRQIDQRLRVLEDPFYERS